MTRTDDIYYREREAACREAAEAACDPAAKSAHLAMAAAYRARIQPRQTMRMAAQ